MSLTAASSEKSLALTCDVCYEFHVILSLLLSRSDFLEAVKMGSGVSLGTSFSHVAVANPLLSLDSFMWCEKHKITHMPAPEFHCPTLSGPEGKVCLCFRRHVWGTN